MAAGRKYHFDQRQSADKKLNCGWETCNISKRARVEACQYQGK
jgi:hypothetical protein